MSIGSRIEKRVLIDARWQPLADRLGGRLSGGWPVAVTALALFTLAIAVAAIVTGEPWLLVVAGSAWLFALSFHLWTTAEPDGDDTRS